MELIRTIQILVSLLLLVSSFSAKANEPEETFDDHVGTWYGVLKQPREGYRDWLIRYFPNGEYVASFRVFSRKSELEDSLISYGTWEIENGLIATNLLGYIEDKKKLPLKFGPLPSNYYILYSDSENLLLKEDNGGAPLAHIAVSGGTDFPTLDKKTTSSLRKKAKDLLKNHKRDEPVVPYNSGQSLRD